MDITRESETKSVDFSTANAEGLRALENAVHRDLEFLQYPRREWVSPRTAADGRRILDVLVIGGGQSGLVTAFALMRERINNILVIDENDEGLEGPWLTFARMKTLRTPKYLTGPDLGIPNLTPRAWFEAQYGEGSWEGVGLVPKEEWARYLAWYRRLLKIAVRNRTRAGAIEWWEAEECFCIPIVSEDGPGELLARKVVLATGISGSGQWRVPDFVTDELPRHFYSHTREDIDFDALRGKRVGVLGAGASAFDNASLSLENGASEVHLFFRRKELVRVNPYRWAEFSGFLRHHRDLPDDLRWKFIHKIICMGQLPPADTFERARRHRNFHLHPGSAAHGIAVGDKDFVLKTANGEHTLDYLIVGTGFVTDLSSRPELQKFSSSIALWEDRFSPPADECLEDMLRHPYLGPHFELTEKNGGEAPWLSSIFNYTFGCLLSQGFGGASISGMKYSVPRLVEGITGQLYRDDIDQHFESLESFNLREF